MRTVGRIPVLCQMRSVYNNGILGNLLQMRIVVLPFFATFANQAHLKICSTVGEILVFTF